MKAFIALFSCFVTVTLGAIPLSGRIIGGEQTKIGVAFYRLSLRYGGDHICGASLISATRALTAAQCRIPTSPLHKYTVMVGSRFLHGGRSSKISMIYAWIAHPSHVPNSNNYDIAVLWLEEEFPLGPAISYIRRPDQDEPVPTGELATVSGWGATVEPQNPNGVPFTFADNLHSTQVKILPNNECNPMMRARDDGRVTDQIICTGSSQSGVCNGDEGGPLVIDGVLVGIVSATGGCTRPDFLTTYTRVSSYADWINSVLTE
ncbi:trypsin-5-like isoform X2 [Sitodiplosis mosellana]|uniref:trypsin-5-like isoform X2 n=1 Tax=Sitodiplosis mosellana TaxID=263140 RepID=UPI0024442F4B|nr:trypsin-5-like isoform X2 [Sitodiplosis mosellana]